MRVTRGVSGVEKDFVTVRNVADLEGFAEFRAFDAFAGVGTCRDAADLRPVVKIRKFKGFATPYEVFCPDVEGADGAGVKKFGAGDGDLNWSGDGIARNRLNIKVGHFCSSFVMLLSISSMKSAMSSSS